MNASALAATAAPPPSPAVLAGQAGIAPLTRVSLAYIEQRIDVYLRFGEPARTIRLDRWRRVAVFLPRAMFCRIHRSEEHTSELQSLMRISYAVFCLKKK